MMILTAPQKFKSTHVVATTSVREEIPQTHLFFCLDRHFSGDWGSVCEEDAETNNSALQDGSRIISAYAIDDSQPCKGYGENCLWIITEAEDDNGLRHVTTILLPEEY